MNRDVFISYASVDKHMADAICSNLENSGIRCWIAPRDILPGSDWAQSILNAIKSSKVMVLVFSQNTSDSSQVTKELNLAISHNLMVVPFKIDDAVPSGSMEYYLADMHWLDTVDGDDQAQINRLKEVISSVLPLNPKEIVKPKPEPSAPAAEAPVTTKVERIIPSRPANEEKVGFFRAYGRFWKKAFDFKGCTSRGEFWKAELMNFIATTTFFVVYALIIGVLSESYFFYNHPGIETVIVLVFLAGLFAPTIPGIALCIRRLHDTNRSGYWMWLICTGIGAYVLLFFFLLKGVEENNRFK